MRSLAVAAFSLLVLAAAQTAEAGLLRDGDPARRLEPVPEPDTARMPERTVATLSAVEADFERRAQEMEEDALAYAYGMLGVRYQAHQLDGAAAPAYRNAIQLAPEVFNWRYYLAFLHEETGDLDAAMDGYRAALELRPDYWPAKMRMGLTALQAGRMADAERSFRAVLADSPEQAAALAGLGRVAAQRDQHETAAKYFRRALELQPGADSLHYRLGLVLRRLGDREAAQEHLAARGETEPQFADEQLAFMQARARPPEFFRQQAQQALKDGRLEEARFNLALAVEIDPSSVVDRLALARVMLLADELDAAETQITEAALHGPDGAAIHLFRGHLAVNRGRDQAALEHYRAAASGGQAVAWVLAGDAAMRLGRYAEAARTYARVSEASGLRGRMELDLFLAAAHLAAGDCDAARERLQAQGPEDQLGPSHRMLRIRAAITCSGSASMTDPVAAARRLHQDFRNAATAETLAMALAAAGRTDEAAGIIREVLFQGLMSGQAVPGAEGLRQELADYEAGRGPAGPFYPGSPLIQPRRVP